MKQTLLLTILLLSGCSLLSSPKPHHEKVGTCMEKFADRGFDADSLVKICSRIFKRRGK